jgi:pyruvate-formate lyase
VLLSVLHVQVIHYMHDKYDYERVMMALHDTYVRRWVTGCELCLVDVSGASARLVLTIRHCSVLNDVAHELIAVAGV